MITKVNAQKMTASEYGQLQYLVGVKEVRYDLDTDEVVVDHDDSIEFNEVNGR